MRENLRHGRELGFAFNLALTMMWAYNTLMVLRDHGAGRELAVELETLSRKHEISNCIVAAQVQRALDLMGIPDSNRGCS